MFSIRRCRECGCTDDAACVTSEGLTCSWAAEDLCTFCAFRLDEEQPLVGLYSEADMRRECAEGR